MSKKTSKAQLQREIKELRDKNTTLEASNSQQKNDYEAKLKDQENSHKAVIKEKNDSHKTEIGQLSGQIKEKDKTIDEKQSQIDKRELKKLAEAFEGQEMSFIDSSSRWFKTVVLSFIFLVTSIIFSVYSSQGVVWYEKFEYYIVNFVILTFLIFSLRQFSYYLRLSTDYANRKTLAQSYHNIINTTEDEPIKQKFLEKVTEILCAPSNVSHESYTVPEKVLDLLAEATKTLSKKV